MMFVHLLPHPTYLPFFQEGFDKSQSKVCSIRCQLLKVQSWICDSPVELPELQILCNLYTHALLDNSCVSYRFDGFYYTLKKSPLRKVSLSAVNPKSDSHLPDYLFAGNRNEYAMQSERRGYLQTQHQSHLDLLQNRSLLESLLMRIVSGKAFFWHYLFVLLYLIHDQF